MNHVHSPAHILIVDDEPEAAVLLEYVLRKDGHRISTAQSGAQALARLEAALQGRDPVQLMLLDLLMPEMDGLAVLRRVRDHPRLSRLPVIVVTAAASLSQEVAGLEAGADDFIAKPYSPQQLLARVRTALRTRYAEEALGRAEELAHLLIGGIRDLVYAADAQGHFTYVSPSAEALTGYTPIELTSGQITLEWLVHPADYERVRAQMQSALDGKSADEVEFRIIRRDGMLLWVAMSVAPLRDANTAGVQGILRDVTARRRAEEALRSRNAELAALNLLAQRISESLDLQVMLSETLDVLMDAVNAEFGILYTLEDNRLRIRAWRGLPASMLAEADSPAATEQLSLSEIRVHRVRENESTEHIPPVAKSVNMQSWVSLPLRNRGQPVGVLVLASRSHDCFEATEVDFVMAAGEQIALGLHNAQLFAEAQRRARELELINQAAHAVSSTLNRQMVLEIIMDRAVQVLQAEAGSVLLLEEPKGDLVFAASAGPASQRLRGTRVPVATSLAGQAVREDRSLFVGDAQHDLRLYRPVDGLTGLTTQNLLAVPLRARGRIIGVLEVINKLGGEFSQADLALLEALAGPAATAIENAQLYEDALRHAEELQRSQAQLIRSEKLAATGRLAVSLAHEINNPLQAIQNFLHLSLDYEVGDNKRREFLEMAREETSRLITLVQQTLEFYRPAQAQAGPVDINAAVERVLALSRKKLQHSDVQVELKLAENLPPVQGMPDQIAQVFLNLIVNAAEAMSDGGQLRIESRADSGHVEVLFADNGPGIAPEDLAHIFEPFYTTKDSGTGLGLAVSYNIIESHGGTIGVESVPGHGTTFTVRLPSETAAKPPTRRRKGGKRKT
jgi:PAS domain S-box-containing protein